MFNNNENNFNKNIFDKNNEHDQYNEIDGTENDDYDQIHKSDLDLKVSYNQQKLILKDEIFRIEYLKDVLDGKVNSIKLDTEIDIQRNSVWDSSKKNKLIDSIFLGIPINYIWLAKRSSKTQSKDSNETHIVIDGKQRLSAIYSFLENKFCLSEKYMTSFKSKEEKELISKKFFKDLEKNLKVIFLESKVMFKIIEINDYDSEDIIWEIFTRINENCPLSKQEIRNAAYSSEFNRILKNELITNEIYKNCFSKKNHLRLKSSELIYRFLGGIKCYKSENKSYSNFPSVAERIVSFMKEAQSYKEENQINKWIEKLNETIEKIIFVFKKNSFKKWSNENSKDNFKYKSTLNVPLAEMQLFTFYTLDFDFVKKNSLKIEKAYKKLFENDPENFLIDLRAATGDPRKMKDRIELFLKYIKNETKQLFF